MKTIDNLRVAHRDAESINRRMIFLSNVLFHPESQSHIESEYSLRAIADFLDDMSIKMDSVVGLLKTEINREKGKILP